MEKQKENLITPFSIVYDSFLSKITDDMYMELTKKETYSMLEELLISALNKFEFPRVNIFDYEIEQSQSAYKKKISYAEGEETIVQKGHFNTQLSREEVNIIATYMVVEWMGQQLASVENIRMKYSGSDFKFTSQANHMQKILTVKKDYEREGFHLQRLYKRRIQDGDGIMRSTIGTIMSGEEGGAL